MNTILVIIRRNRKKIILIITFFSEFDRQRADGGPLAISIAGMPPAGRYSNADWELSP